MPRRHSSLDVSLEVSSVDSAETKSEYGLLMLGHAGCTLTWNLWVPS